MRLLPLVITLPLSLLACSPPADGDPGPGSAGSGATSCTFTVELGVNEASGFRPYTAGEQVGIVLGFQGFRYIEPTIRIRGAEGEAASLGFQATIEGREPAAQDGGMAHLIPDGDGLRIDMVQVFFNDVPMPQVVDHQLSLVTSVTIGGCTRRATNQLKLVSSGCTEHPDGSKTCDAPSH